MKIRRPHIEQPGAHHAAMPGAYPPSDGDKAEAQPALVLIVDDMEAIRSMMRITLEDRGFVVLTAEDGESGLAIFEAQRDRIDAVVLDMTLPQLSGAEVLKRLRQMRPDVAVVVCSGYDVADDADLGAIDFIQKPYQTEVLISRLREIAIRRGRRV